MRKSYIKWLYISFDFSFLYFTDFCLLLWIRSISWKIYKKNKNYSHYDWDGFKFKYSKYKKVNKAEDVYDDNYIFIEGIGDGIQKAIVNTVKNVSLGIRDTLSFGDVVEEVANTAT